MKSVLFMIVSLWSRRGVQTFIVRKQFLLQNCQNMKINQIFVQILNFEKKTKINIF